MHKGKFYWLFPPEITSASDPPAACRIAPSRPRSPLRSCPVCRTDTCCPESHIEPPRWAYVLGDGPYNRMLGEVAQRCASSEKSVGHRYAPMGAGSSARSPRIRCGIARLQLFLFVRLSTHRCRKRAATVTRRGSLRLRVRQIGYVDDERIYVFPIEGG
jgi:hypothetical protein